MTAQAYSSAIIARPRAASRASGRCLRRASISAFQSTRGRYRIDVPLALQSATLDLTQIGFNASVDKGPWTWAIAWSMASGKIDSSRDTGFGLATAGYNAQSTAR